MRRDDRMTEYAGSNAPRPLAALLTACFALLSLTACSNEAIYQSIQQDGLRGCEEIPIAQQASCKAQYQKDYATYKRERDALQEG